MSSKVNFSFQPSATRARALDLRMRSGLASSLTYVAEELESHHQKVDQDKLSSFLVRLRKDPTPPLSFAIYWDIVRAIDADDLDAATTLLAELTAQPSASSELSIVNLGDRWSDPTAERYARFIDADPELPIDLLPPSSSGAENTRRAIDHAFALMDAGDPELAAEIREILREIILCSGKPGAALQFDGASSFMLWGAVLINAEREGSDLSMVQMLAHETAHNLLFALGSEEALLTNDSGQRFASPLRRDPRPLEGIYHATFVSARMYRAMKVLAESTTLSPADQKIAENEAGQNKKAFLDGLNTLDTHADFTETGRAILESSREYVSSLVS